MHGGLSQEMMDSSVDLRRKINEISRRDRVSIPLCSNTSMGFMSCCALQWQPVLLAASRIYGGQTGARGRQTFRTLDFCATFCGRILQRQSAGLMRTPVCVGVLAKWQRCGRPLQALARMTGVCQSRLAHRLSRHSSETMISTCALVADLVGSCPAAVSRCLLNS